MPRLPPADADRMRDVRATSSSSGFTLVEVILAVSIAALVLASLFALYFATSQSVDAQSERRAGGASMSRAMDRLTRDLSNALPVPGYDEGGFALTKGEPEHGDGSVLRFCTARRTDPFDGDTRALRWFEIIEVDYRLERAPRERGKLVRTERPLVGPGAISPPSTNVLAVGVDGFEVQIRQGAEWVDEWVVELGDDQAEWPRAARIQLIPDARARDARPYAVDVLIPTGWTIAPQASE